MNDTIKSTLLFSFLINILFVGMGIIFIARRGGLSYLWQKLSSLRSERARLTAMYNNPFYQDKTSHFRNLPKSELGIIFLGDSLTDLCEWAELLENDQIKNRGICGDTTDGILNRIDNIIEYQPQKLFILIGINDLNQGRQVSEIVENYNLILSSIKNKLPNIKVFIQSVLPVNQQKFQKSGVNDKVIELNIKLRELAKKFSYQYIDLFSAFLDINKELDSQYTTDGVHLNGQGYLLWKGIIEKDVIQ
jgi:lysophospholipase L1-like esterase